MVDRRALSVVSDPPEVWPGFTVKAFDELADYVRATADELELRDWTFNVQKVPHADDDTFAETVVAFAQKRATITLCKDWPEIDEPKRRRIVAHELTHCHLDHGFRYLEDTLEVLVGAAASRAIINAAHVHLEIAVDAIAEAIARHLPPIP